MFLPSKTRRRPPTGPSAGRRRGSAAGLVFVVNAPYPTKRHRRGDAIDATRARPRHRQQREQKISAARARNPAAARHADKLVDDVRRRHRLCVSWREARTYALRPSGPKVRSAGRTRLYLAHKQSSRAGRRCGRRGRPRSLDLARFTRVVRCAALAWLRRRRTSRSRPRSAAPCSSRPLSRWERRMPFLKT